MKVCPLCDEQDESVKYYKEFGEVMCYPCYECNLEDKAMDDYWIEKEAEYMAEEGDGG